MTSKYTIAIDFDGVVHRYSQGWHNGTAYDVPMDGAYSALLMLLDQYSVFIFSSRDSQEIVHWFNKHLPDLKVEEIPEDMDMWKKKGVIGVTTRKLPAYVIIDDRAIKFENWAETLDEIYRRFHD